MAALKAEITKVSEGLSTGETEHVGEEVKLRKRKMKAEMDLKVQLETFDQNMMRVAEEMAEIQKQYDVELSELRKLEEYFAKYDAERVRITEEEKVIEAESQARMAELKTLDHAATKIQCVWRGKDARAKLKTTKKGKKGKKGKGKKKKK